MGETISVRCGDRTVAVAVKRSRRRRRGVSLQFEYDLFPTISVPADASTRSVRRFLNDHRDWLHERAVRADRQPVVRFEDGAPVPYLGRDLTLRLVEDAAVWVERWDDTFCLFVPDPTRPDPAAASAAFLRWYYDTAYRRLPARADAIHQRMHGTYAPAAIRVRNQRKRWGSCATDATIRINWRTVLLTPRLGDYVVAHELAHLREKGHGPGFWQELSLGVDRPRRAHQRFRAQAITAWSRFPLLLHGRGP